MVDWIDMVEASIWGVVAGFVTSALGGPINVTVINESAHHGFKRSLMITFGAVLMESVYCAVAFAGFSGFLEHAVVQATMELISFFLVLWLGIQYLRIGPVQVDNSVEEFVERRLHPTSGFWTGFIRVLGNPGVLLLWIGITGSLIAHGALEPVWICKGLFCGCVALSSLTWFVVLSWGISHRKCSGGFSTNGLRRLSQFSGIVLLITAAIIGVRLVILLEHARQSHRPYFHNSGPEQGSTSDFHRDLA